MGKYARLAEFLRQTPARLPGVTLSFRQIELILDDKLPLSSGQRQWWANPRNPAENPQAQAWLDSGFKVTLVDLTAGFVEFSRQPTTRRQTCPTGTPPVWSP
jgi:hypothetical protein